MTPEQAIHLLASELGYDGSWGDPWQALDVLARACGICLTVVRPDETGMDDEAVELGAGGGRLGAWLDREAADEVERARREAGPGAGQKSGAPGC